MTEDSPKTETPEVEKPKVEKVAKPKTKPKAEEPKAGPETVEQAVEKYNEMVLTAVDLKIPKISTVKTFADLKTGKLACLRLDAAIQRAREPKPAAKEKAVKKSAKTKSKKSDRASLSDETKITWSGKENPFREKSGKWQRTEKVRESSGQTVKTMRGKRIKTGTIRTLLRMGLVKSS